MKKFIRWAVIVLLAGITAASIYMYTVVEQEKNALMNSLKQMEMQIESLEADKQTLANEKQELLQAVSAKEELVQGLTLKNEELGQELQSCQDKFTEFDDNSQNSQKIIDQLNADIGLLKTEAASLKTENSYLRTTNNSLSNENASLKTELAAGRPGQEPAKGSVPPPRK